MNQQTIDFRKKLAQQFIDALEEQELDWKKEWEGTSNIPKNATTNKAYSGINRFNLMLIGMARNTKDPRWATFKQIQDNGWKLKKGSKGAQIEYWMPYDVVDKKALSWQDFRNQNLSFSDKRYMLTAKYFHVFNAEDIDNIPELTQNINPTVEQDVLIDKLQKNMDIKIYNDGGDRAFYRPSEDAIHLPAKESFHSTYDYNSTALHELAHSTGASHRLNRDMKTSYAREELVAEITSAFSSVNLQASQSQEHINNHKAYVQSWIQMIKDKPETLMSAISDAQKAAEYMDFKAELINEKQYMNSKDVSETVEVKNTEVAQVISPEGFFAKHPSDFNLSEQLQLHVDTDILLHGSVSTMVMNSISENGFHLVNNKVCPISFSQMEEMIETYHQIEREEAEEASSFIYGL